MGGGGYYMNVTNPGYPVQGVSCTQTCRAVGKSCSNSNLAQYDVKSSSEMTSLIKIATTQNPDISCSKIEQADDVLSPAFLWGCGPYSPPQCSFGSASRSKFDCDYLATCAQRVCWCS